MIWMDHCGECWLPKKGLQDSLELKVLNEYGKQGGDEGVEIVSGSFSGFGFNKVLIIISRGPSQVRSSKTFYISQSQLKLATDR